MNKIKLYQLKNIKQCPFKAYISQFDFKTITKKSLTIRKVYKSILQETDFINLSENNLKSLILEKLENTYFLTQQEKDVEVNIILKHLLRYIDYERNSLSLGRKIITKKLYGTVQIEDKEIEVSADIVFDNGNNIELVKYKTSATKLSYKARTEKNLPQNDIELFLLKKLGEQKYPNKTVIASFYHLKGKNDEKDIYKQFLDDKEKELLSNVNELKSITGLDKKEQKKIDKQVKEIEDVLYFNNSVGNNIITFEYDNDLSESILELANKELNFDSEKCQSGDCEFCDYSTLCNYKKPVNNEFEIVQEVKKSSGEIKLTDAQKQVVGVENGIYRINACAGAGKSSVMVLRTIELFKKGYSPKDILLITFTNKGAYELKEKIAYWLKYYNMNNINVNQLNIFTFNGFGETIIAKEWERLGFTQKPQLATMIDVNDIVKELLVEYDKVDWLNYKNPLMNYPNAKGAFKQLLIYFNLIKSFDYNVDRLIENVLIKEKGNLNTEQLHSKSILIFEMYGRFNNMLKEKNLLQYQDQVLYLIELLNSDSRLIEKYGYKHIVVDEYQDTNITQIVLLQTIKQYKDFLSFMVVGDSDQSIFSFTNTTPENLINFHEEFENVQDIFLLENFRSTPQICNVANKLVKLNTKRIDKDIISKKADGKVPQLLKFKTIDDENKYIADLIQEKISNGIPKHEICYIARTKKELLELQKVLTEKGIDNIVEVSELYIDNMSVQSIINLANFFKNMDNDYYLMEYISIIDKNIRNASVKEVKMGVNETKMFIMEDFDDIDCRQNEDWGESENDEYNKNNNVNPNELSKIQYFNDIISPVIESDEIAKSFMENVNSKTFYTFNEYLNYLNKFILYNDDSAIDKDEIKYNAVVLTTAHSSKGKEWDVVINSINNYKYDGLELDDLEEERRLLFVSITRAKNELYVTFNTNENKTRGKGNYCKFSDELEDVERIEI